MKAERIINLLAKDSWTRNLCIPNFTPRHWWECDLAEITPAGFFREYEVKLSVSDFRADAKKIDDTDSQWFGKQGPFLSKHQSLEIGHEYGPTQFWFVSMAGLLPRHEIPAWAGLMEISEGRSYFDEVKKAPSLHRRKWTAEEIEQSRKCFYYRYWNLRRKR